MAEGVFAIRWQAITPAQIPFPTSDSLTGTNLANGVILNNVPIPRYQQPEFADIWFVKAGGGNAPLQICFGPAQVGKKVKLYINFSAIIYEYEVQVWAAGCWTVLNPGSGSASPNFVYLGNPVDIFSDFNPGESNPNFPPPTYNPFIPRLLISLEQDPGECMTSETFKVTVNQIPRVDLQTAAVYKDGVQLPGIALPQLLSGVIFTDPGEYRISISYKYLGDLTNPIPNPPIEYMTRDFTISTIPFPHMQRQSRTYGYLYPGEAIRFNDELEGDGTIEYNLTTGEFRLRFCGDYFVKWFVAPRSGYTVNGSNFAVAVNGSTDLIGSDHIKASQAVGFSVIKVNGPPVIIELINISGDTLFLSQAELIKAGIVIFRIGDETPLVLGDGNSTESEAAMSISYLELEKSAAAGDLVAVNPDDPIVFDIVVSSGGSQITYDYNTGEITFHAEGFYYFDWYVAPQYGLTTNGSNWAVQTSGGQTRIGSSHIKVSSTVGFAIMRIEAEETARLVNVSDSALTLSQAVLSQAALIVYSVTAMNFAP